MLTPSFSVKINKHDFSKGTHEFKNLIFRFKKVRAPFSSRSVSHLFEVPCDKAAAPASQPVLPLSREL